MPYYLVFNITGIVNYFCTFALSFIVFGQYFCWIIGKTKCNILACINNKKGLSYIKQNNTIDLCPKNSKGLRGFSKGKF
jgi:hypothetical protein